ncbi:hypothetical protein [Parasitella parasitica]|uniref:Uncharacterized protein n=1 Tax=Parasitella parasitica TaxID=35722 RepID=A0A0B7N3R5_9FUNG|nr:hypothetical protein [Parasitella parasitica]
MASSTEKHKVRDPTSFTDRTIESWAEKAKQQERASLNIAPNLDIAFGEPNVQSYLSQTMSHLEAIEPYYIAMDCAQFEGKTKKFFEISFTNEERRVAALNCPFHLQNKAIVVSPTLDSSARIVYVGITGIPGLNSVSIRNRLTEIHSPCGDILELGLHYMLLSGHWFNGRGFATLNCATDETYNGKLKHQMPFNEYCNITLIWSNMGVVCKECHSDEHIKAGLSSL